MKNKKIIICAILALFAIVALPVLAETPQSKYLTNPIGITDIPTLVGRIIKAVLGVVGSIALVMFIYGGFVWLTSGGAPQKIDKGKNIITWAVIGLVIIFLSYTMVNFVIKGLTSSGTSQNTETLPGVCCQYYVGAVPMCDMAASASECPSDATAKTNSFCNESSGLCQ